MPDQCEGNPCPWDLGGDGINDFMELPAKSGDCP